jgi:ppGpp synthetase/RelA/SpoT-type nucleotidyltranferase
MLDTPRENGYRAIHLQVEADVAVEAKQIAAPVEVQIRSTLQEAWGHYTHADFYHADTGPDLIINMTRELSDLLYWADKHAATLVDELAKALEAAQVAVTEPTDDTQNPPRLPMRARPRNAGRLWVLPEHLVNVIH